MEDSMQRLNQWLVWVTSSLLLLALVGCSQEIDVTVWEGNQFSATILNSIPINEDNTEAEIRQELDSQVSDIRGQPNITTATWERIETNEDEFRAEITVEGNDYTAIERVLEGGATVRTTVVDGQEAVEFTYDYSPTLAYTLTLHSGEVLSTNGEQVDSDTAQWNGGIMTAVVRPKSRGSDMLMPMALGVVGILVVGVGLVWFFRSRGKATA
jgi:hypothetical protein